MRRIPNGCPIKKRLSELRVDSDGLVEVIQRLLVFPTGNPEPGSVIKGLTKFGVEADYLTEIA